MQLGDSRQYLARRLFSWGPLIWSVYSSLKIICNILPAFDVSFRIIKFFMDLLNWKRFICILKDCLIRAILIVMLGNMNFRNPKIYRLSLTEHHVVVTLSY